MWDFMEKDYFLANAQIEKGTTLFKPFFKMIHIPYKTIGYWQENCYAYD